MEKSKLLIATTNPGKLLEIRNFLSSIPVHIYSLLDLNITETPIENGKTFSENAIIKAKFYWNLSHMMTIADDGGLEITALGGAPGVLSHRWVDGDHESTDEELINYTLLQMNKLPDTQRQAQLHLVMAFIDINGSVEISEALVKGIIPLTATTRRTPGFPFRSLLYIPDIGKYYDNSEMTEKEINKYNHRLLALKKLLPMIKERVGV